MSLFYAMYDALKWPSLNIRRQIHWLQLIFKCIHFNYPSYLQQYLVPITSNYQLRHSAQLYFSVPRAKKSVGKRAFMFKAPLDWNNLPSDIRSIASFGMYRHTLSSYLVIDFSCNEWCWHIVSYTKIKFIIILWSTYIQFHKYYWPVWPSSVCKVLYISVISIIVIIVVLFCVFFIFLLLFLLLLLLLLCIGGSVCVCICLLSVCTRTNV